MELTIQNLQLEQEEIGLNLDIVNYWQNLKRYFLHLTFTFNLMLVLKVSFISSIKLNIYRNLIIYFILKFCVGNST